MESIDSIYLRHSTHYAEVLSLADDLCRKGEDSAEGALLLLEECWENIKLGQYRASEYAHINEDAAELCCKYPINGLKALSISSNSREHVQWVLAALSTVRRMMDIVGEAILLNNLAD